jgi:rubrerythrin
MSAKGGPHNLGPNTRRQLARRNTDMAWANSYVCRSCNTTVTAAVGPDKVPHCPYCQQDLGLPIALEVR